jgi:hypothetical protein
LHEVRDFVDVPIDYFLPIDIKWFELIEFVDERYGLVECLYFIIELPDRFDFIFEMREECFKDAEVPLTYFEVFEGELFELDFTFGVYLLAATHDVEFELLGVCHLNLGYL